MPRSRSFTRLTMRVGLLHLGQSVDFVVSISFLRSPVLAILAMTTWDSPYVECLCSRGRSSPAASTVRPSLHSSCLTSSSAWMGGQRYRGSATRTYQSKSIQHL